MNLGIEVQNATNCFSLLEKEYNFSSYKKGNLTYVKPREDVGTGYMSVNRPCDDILIMERKLCLNTPITIHYENFDLGYEAAYCISGNIIHRESDNCDMHFMENEMGIFLKDKSRGRVILPSKQNIHTISIHSKGKLIEDFSFKEKMAALRAENKENLTNSIMIPSKPTVQIHNLFKQLVECEMDESIFPTFCESVSKTILSLLWQNKVLDVIDNKGNNNFSMCEKKAIWQANNIISKRYIDPPSIAQLAREVGLNEYKLKKGFREIYGKTIYDFVREIRMENALNLLEDDDLTISQIAYEVGYVNTSHFSKNFRKRFGKNPRDFRRGV